ncbi:unnamed protein product [Adineta ricciae]|uniref:Uncharacterized protein n=1 Tax=Adineta ricciae TaxID=249248 RepID=A0A814DAG7_ADIRI|nr:unnamed protein product [Adineta ricciae]CAF0951782.1 unnamed protein product [Adineta ricciae]
MDHPLFTIRLSTVETPTITSETIASSFNKDDISFFFPSQSSSNTIEFREQIRYYLLALVKSIHWKNITTEIDDILINDVIPAFAFRNERFREEMEYRQIHKQQFEQALMDKLQEDANTNTYTCTELSAISAIENSQAQKEKCQAEQLSYFTIQSLISILLVLFKSAEKNDPAIIHQILTLADQLCEQLPIRYFSSRNTLLLKSFEPLTNYIYQLSLTSDILISKQSTKILLIVSMAKRSFKDILSLMNKLIFNITDIYKIKRLIMQMNDVLTTTLAESKQSSNVEFASLTYLKSINSYPNDQLSTLSEHSLTGQFISSIILSHIDIENEIHSPIKQSKLSSISLEFHSDTFRDLFGNIEQLSVLLSTQSNQVIIQILTVCLRLFTTHLQILSECRDHMSTYTSNTELNKWFDLLFQLICNHNKELSMISEQASKALINVINLQNLSFDQKLILFQKYIMKNEHSTLIAQILVELNQSKTLFDWIEFLNTEMKESTTLDFLHWLIDLYFENKEKPVEEILLSLQQRLLYDLIEFCKNQGPSNGLLSVIVQYFTYILRKCLDQHIVAGQLLSSILIDLNTMVTTKEIFPCEFIYPIFTAVLPLLADYYLNNLDNDFLCCLIGQISHSLIVGTTEDSFEKKHQKKLQLPIFTGGCTIDENSDLLTSSLALYNPHQFEDSITNDKEFLMSVYNNTGDGARLLSAMKMQTEGEHHSLPKSIEQQVDDARAALFAVYLKFYRIDQSCLFSEHISIYEYANEIQTVFIITKSQGGNCDELCRQIRMKALFLLLTVGEDVSVVKIELEKDQATQQQHIYQSRLHDAIADFIYGEYSKRSTTIAEQQAEIDELDKCLRRQHQRALLRLITYRFIDMFLQKVLNRGDNDRSRATLLICLPYMRSSSLEWSYIANIFVANTRLKDEISRTYHSIIRFALTFIFQFDSLILNILYLLSFSYEPTDIYHLSNHGIVESFFHCFVSCVDYPNKKTSLTLQFTTFNWFRMFVLNLCENVDMEKSREISNETVQQQQQNFVFNTLIFNELKALKFAEQISSKNSLQNISIGWFLQPNDMNLCLNQYLVLLLQSFYVSKHVAPICATIEYLHEFIEIYQHNQSNVTRLLLIKILRHIVPYIVSDDEQFLSNTLNSIGEKMISQDIIAEFIAMYRTIMSTNCHLQLAARELVFNVIKLNLDLNSIDTLNQNQLLAALNIMGGYIEPYRLGSIVTCQTKKIFHNESSLGLIVEINEAEQKYLVQYLLTNETELVSIDQLRLQIDVPPPTSPSNEVDSILDSLGHFIETVPSDTDSLLLLQLKRQSISVLYSLLNDTSLIHVFMAKPYAAILAKLALPSSSEGESHRKPHRLRSYDRKHLEQYSLGFNAQSKSKETRNEIDTFIAYNGWRPYTSDGELEFLRRGRIGDERLPIAAMPRHCSDPSAIELCGMKHRFRGRIAPTKENTEATFPTYIVDNLQLSEGKWYYCVRLLVAQLIQIGWATYGFEPRGDHGVGDDQYSWSYDGSRAVFFNNGGYCGQFHDYHWKDNDICGCGIEIDGTNTKIKYWINGTFVGTAFEHDSFIPLTNVKCNLLPNGSSTTYFPAISLQNYSSTRCEIIVSPEDMDDCPLPHGYKPLLLPVSINMEKTLVSYPFSAYLVGDDSHDYFLRTSRNTLRDFVHQCHLQTSFSVDNQYLILSDNSNGFQLSIDNNETSSTTISFDFQIIPQDQQSNFVLFTFDLLEIKWDVTPKKCRCVVIFSPQDMHIKVRINHTSRTFSHTFQYETITNFNLCILPGVAGKINNVAVWKYTLSEEDIRCLFTYSLSYVAHDYRHLLESRKQVATISFHKNQREFPDEILIPFTESYTKELWIERQRQADNDEEKYFKSNDDEDYSTVELFGNKTHLIFNKSLYEWSKYILAVELSVPCWPNIGEELALIYINSRFWIFINDRGKICVENDGTKSESDSSIIPNEYFRVLISLQNDSFQVYLNNRLEILTEVTKYQFHVQSRRIFLFRELNPTKNTTSDDTLRISFKSLTYLNRSMPIDQLQSAITTTSLILNIQATFVGMGYKPSWIQSVIAANPMADISTIHSLLHQQKTQFMKRDCENEQKRYLNILSQLEDLTPSPNVQMDFKDNWFSKSVENLHIGNNINTWMRHDSTMINDKSKFYKLFDVNELTANQESVHYSHEDLSSEQLLENHIACEHGLITVYARETILNMFQVWSTGQLTLFPIEKFGDYTFLIELLKLLDHIADPYKQKATRVRPIVNSILKHEIKHLPQYIDVNDLQKQAPLLYHLERFVKMQSIACTLKPSPEQNVKFLWKTLEHFLEILTDKSALLFRLFLLIPEHQSKINILHIFTALLQTSKCIQITPNIQQFVLHLLIELSSDKIVISTNAKSKFEFALRDLLFVLLARQKKQSSKEDNYIEIYQSKLPGDTQRLFDSIDLIIAWTDGKSLPEFFFIQWEQLFREDSTPSDEDMIRSHNCFSLIANQELIRFMNGYTLVKDNSFFDFLATLPRESEPNPVFYKNYFVLSRIPADAIRARTTYVYVLNKIIKKSLFTLDFNQSEGQSILTDYILSIKSYLLISTKFHLFNVSLEQTSTDSISTLQSVYFDTVQASTAKENSKSSMFYQAYQQLHSNAHILFRRLNKQLWCSQYLDMHSTNTSGHYHDSIMRICSDICSTRLPLFILCSNGRRNRGSNRDCWIPNVFPPHQPIPKNLQKQYRFVGQLLGMAIRKKHYLNIKFPTLVWKYLLKKKISMKDIEAVDNQSFTFLNEVEKNVEQIKAHNGEKDVESLFISATNGLRFDIISSSEQTYELIPGGSNISITMANFDHFCSCYRHYRLHEFDRQISCIREGLHSVIPYYYLSLFTANELEEAVCGKDRIDIELLKRNTCYTAGYEPDSPTIELFWKVLTESFTGDQKNLFLRFVWERSTLPIHDEDFQPKFTIAKLHVSEEQQIDRTLPRSHASFFTIELPPYSSNEVMYERLNYAISSSSSIDSDGLFNNNV